MRIDSVGSRGTRAAAPVYIAAKLLAAGGRIADTVGYESWPERER
jgi:hypothetical protein